MIADDVTTTPAQTIGCLIDPAALELPPTHSIEIRLIQLW
jgi:hypothetical protein